jgi:hypothetical protein
MSCTRFKCDELSTGKVVTAAVLSLPWMALVVQAVRLLARLQFKFSRVPAYV